MPNKVFTVTEVPGSKRASERDYTHAVIGQYDYTSALESADKIYPIDITNHKYQLSRTDGAKHDSDYYENYMAKYGHMTPEEFAYDRQLDRLVELTKRYEENNGRYGVLRWSQSQANAAKGHSEFSMYTNLKVVETIRIK